MNISLVMIVKNEEKILARSLESVKGLVNEIIVVDSGSADDTVKIAESFGAKVYKRDFDSFVNQKNYALSLASNEWVLHLDADEVLSDELKNEIRQLSDSTDCDGFYLTRENAVLGRHMKHGGIKNEKRLRLAKKSKSCYEGFLIHEELKVKGKTEMLKNVFYHYTLQEIDKKYFDKFISYADLSARKMNEAGKKAGFADILCRPFMTFFKTYIIRLGFLDGIEGLIWAGLAMCHNFFKYTKLWQMKRK